MAMAQALLSASTNLSLLRSHRLINLMSSLGSLSGSPRLYEQAYR
jgi:hypothetical protein